MTSIRDHILDGTPDDVVARYEALPELARRSDFGVLDRNVVVVDTETTGFSFNHDELIQIAAARLERGEITGWYVTFVNPGKPLPEDIVNLTHIHESDVADAPSPQEALAGLVEFARDAIMVAHNVGFDRTFTTRHPEGYPLLENRWVDTLDLSRIALPRLKSHRLIDLVRTFGAPTSTHRADDDVAATCVVYRTLLAAVASMPSALVREIAHMAPEPDWPTGYVFKEFADGGAGGSAGFARGDGAGEGVAQGAGAAATAAAAAGENAPATTRPAFSLRTMRQKRILELPTRPARKDADDLVGEIVFPAAEEIQAAFTETGVIGRMYADYEPREEQRSMATAINDAFAAGENIVVEAGTGVGKSMAYLVPAALLARANNITVGVATKTNSLLDQLVYQELPALAEAMGNVSADGATDSADACTGAPAERSAAFASVGTPLSASAEKDATPAMSQGTSAGIEGENRASASVPPLTWAPLKGMAHYPCLRRTARLVDDGPGTREVAGAQVHQAPSLAALLSYIEQSEYSDLDGLKIDYRALPRYLFTTTSAECLRRKCPFFGKLCFAHGARRRAETADIVVTNHTLLFCNVAADGSLLPTIRHWVVDEAHATESEARAAFAETLDCEQLARISGRVAESAGGRNVFTRAERAMSSGDVDQLTLFFALVAKGKSAGSTFTERTDDYTTRVKDLLFFDPAKSRSGRKQPAYDHVDVWINGDVRRSERFADVAGSASELVEATDKLIKATQDLVAYLEGIDEAAVSQRELASLAFDLRSVRNAAEVIYQLAPESYAYHASIHRKKDRHNDTAEALLLDVGEKMNELFYAQTHSVAYTSATLAIGKSFDSFEAAVGLNSSEFSTARELQLDSSYDFDNNMIVYVVTDMPEPNDPRYLDTLNGLLVRAHLALGGSMLTLFTNRREMERSFEFVYPQMKAEGLRLVCQKYGVSVKGLRDDFLADEHLSLFALKSFWEGFDAPGATLRGVVIPKLPFARPTDPLYCERAARDDRAWWRYVLPQAVIETKQAAGRLIRKADDHGVLILADKRLVSKSYGKTFLNSLQSRTIRFATIDEIVNSLSFMR